MTSGASDPKILSDLLEMFVRRADEDRRAAFVLGISALSLLVDSGVATTEQAVARIDRVRDGLPERLRSERLDQHLKLAQDWLRIKEEASGAEPPRPRWTPEVIPGGAGTE